MIGPSTKDIITIVRSYAYKNGMSMSEFAEQAGVSKAWLSKLKTQNREISLHLAEQLLDAAGYKIVVKHQSKLTSEDKHEIEFVSKQELDRKDKENLEVNKLIDKNKQLLEQDNKEPQASIFTRLRKVLSNEK